MSLRVKVAGTLLCITTAYNAQASDSSIYAGISIGQSSYDSGYTDLTGTASIDENDTNYKVFAGYQFNKYLSLEGHYANLGKFRLSGNLGDTYIFEGTTYGFVADNDRFVLEGTTVGLAAIVSYPISQVVEPFIKAGIHRWDIDAKQTWSGGSHNASAGGTDPFFGVGAAIEITKAIQVRAELERYILSNENVDTFSLGLQYRF